MANLNVRINHKFDSFSNWMNSDLVLNKGELAIAEIPSAQTESGLTPPAIGIKVGDGENKFSGLKWIQATAGDVHTWAKAAKKPEYTAEEIQGLESYIAGQIQDTNTTYTLTTNGRLVIHRGRFSKDIAIPLADIRRIERIRSARLGAFCLKRYLLVHYAQGQTVSLIPTKEEELLKLLATHEKDYG